MTIVVCPLSFVPTVVRTRSPSHVITLLDPWHEIETPEGIAPERHLRLGVNDICDPVKGMVAADEVLVTQLIEFGRGWNPEAPLLIHCWAGISRSTASAFVLACERNPDVAETRIAEALRGASPSAHPNRRIVRLADDLLGRRGRMADAVEAIGYPGEFYEGRPFDLPVRYDP